MTDIFTRLKQDHDRHREMLDRVAATSGDSKELDSSGWLTRFKTLKERLEHHMDEEEDEIFAAARKDLSAERTKELAKIFDDRKPVEKKEVA